MNKTWPDGRYEKAKYNTKGLFKVLKKNCIRARSFNKEDLMLELL